MTGEIGAVEAAIEAVQRELGKQEMLLTDPITLQRMMARRCVMATLTALSENVTEAMVEAGCDGDPRRKEVVQFVFRAMLAEAGRGK